MRAPAPPLVGDGAIGTGSLGDARATPDGRAGSGKRPVPAGPEVRAVALGKRLVPQAPAPGRRPA
ncbi:hypothetical protein GCM10010236_19820 [Streptomyces eurythermus]|nr:hypothetical protein GCM10010236_19820 [Streptomyces eurythermus]